MSKTASATWPGKWYSNSMTSLTTSSANQGKLTLPTKLGNRTSNLHSRKKSRKLALTHSPGTRMREWLPTIHNPTDTSLLDSIRDKWFKINLRRPLVPQLTVTRQLELLSRNLMPRHSPKCHQIFKLPRILKKTRKKTTQTLGTSAKAELERTIEDNFLWETSGCRMNPPTKSHRSN